MDFDLSQALDGSPTFDDMTFQPSCFDMTDVQTEIYKLDTGVNLVVSCDHKKMQRVANLLVAVARMKKSMINCGLGLSNEQLCNGIMESLVEETIIEMSGQSSAKKTYRRANSVKQCTLRDFSQKDVVHIQGEMKLQAITLKGGNCEHKVRFQLSRYVTCDPSNKGETVVLSIRNSNIHISSSMDGNRAMLQLEELLETELNTISNEENMGRFLFYKSIFGINETKFESVQCPGWYISTSSVAENQPVEMCQADNAGRLMSFKTN